MWNLEGRTAIVTGAGHGIGRATAELLSSAGVRVVVADIDESAALEACNHIGTSGGVAVPFIGDLAEAEVVRRLIDTTLQIFGSVDNLFANAAIQMVKPAADMSEGEWDRLMAVNLRAVFLCCRGAIPAMKANGRGSIVIAASGHAFATYRGFAGYAATKGGLVAFMRGLALDYAADGIRSNCVIPGATDTRLLRDFFSESADPAAARARMEQTIPLGRLAEPVDIGKAVLFLVSDHAAYITGTCLAVDGGLMAQG